MKSETHPNPHFEIYKEVGTRALLQISPLTRNTKDNWKPLHLLPLQMITNWSATCHILYRYLILISCLVCIFIGQATWWLCRHNMHMHIWVHINIYMHTYLHIQIEFLQKLYILSWWLSNSSPTRSDTVITADRLLQTMVLFYMLFKGLPYS